MGIEQGCGKKKPHFLFEENVAYAEFYKISVALHSLRWY